MRYSALFATLAVLAQSAFSSQLKFTFYTSEDGLGEPTGPVGIEPDNLFLLGAKCVAPDEDQADPLIKSVKVEQVDDDDITNEEIFTLDEAREEWRYCLQTFSDAGCEDDLDQIAFLETSGVGTHKLNNTASSVKVTRGACEG